MKIACSLGLLAVFAVTPDVASATEALDAVLAADSAFATLSLERGQQLAFQENLADDGILFRPTAVAGLEWLATHEQASGRLEWSPAAGAAACTGLLAVTTGSWKYSNVESGDVTAGHYLSVWRVQPDGRWRVVLDHGIDHVPGASPAVALPAAFAALWPEVPAKACRAARRSESLEEAERNLNDVIRSNGLGQALRRSAVDGALAYRDDSPPGPLEVTARSMDAAFAAGSESRPQVVSAEPGSNMGYSFGEISAPAQGPSPPARAVYVRVWQSDGKRWRIAIDMLTPLAADGSP